MDFRFNRTLLFRIVYLIVFLTVLYFLLSGIFETEPEVAAEEPEIVLPKTNVFGFIDDSLNVYSRNVNRNETLSDILEAYNLTNTNVSEIASLSKPVFDVRKLRAGKKYHLYTLNDSMNTLNFFVYEKDDVNFVVYDLRDSVDIYNGKKEITRVKNTKSAEIKSSLFEALMESDASIELAIELSKIYAWQIDFYHLQKGDNFKVIYEEEYVDSQMVGIGKILGAYFKHRNKEFLAIPFMQDSIYQFFDENGQSLRKEFLKTPIEFARISSRYSSSRLHPVLKIRRPHRGVDYAAPTGTPIRTVGDGQVIEAAYTRSNGNYVKIRHNSVYTTMYLHMSRFGKGIKRGVQVKQGQVIGYVGKTGLATGSHLHFSFFMNGSYVNPLTIEVPPSHPVKETLNGEFEKQKIIVLDELMKIDKTIVSENDPPV
ncbi:peptidoglycan DD-metalloendopeptidase family protein [Bacteroidota bacterium]